MSVRRWGTIVATPYTGDIPEILKSQELLTKPAGGAVILPNSPLIQPGTFLKRLTSGPNIYYWVPSKVGMVDTVLGAPTTTTFYSRNLPWAVGDIITVGAAAGAVVSAIDYVTHLVTVSSAITLPTVGMRVFSATAADDTIDAIALDFLPPIPDAAQAVEVAITGIFKKDYFDQMYHATDLAAWGAVAVAAFNAYRWS